MLKSSSDINGKETLIQKRQDVMTKQFPCNFQF